MTEIRVSCDGAGNKYGCGNPVVFVARHESETEGEFVCGKHLAAALKKRNDGAWRVAVVRKGSGAMRKARDS